MASHERIFVIESDQVIRSALGFILSEDRETFTFSEIDDALAKADQFRPDVVLLGLGLIERHGAELVADLVGQLPCSSIILVANSASAPLVQDGLHHGARAVISKPISFDGVRGKVDSVLAARPSGSGLGGAAPTIVSTQLNR